jgi:hypothetical protein
MTLYYPQLATRPAAEHRSREALIGIAIGVVTCAASVAVAITYALRVRHLEDVRDSYQHFPFPTDRTGPVVLITITTIAGLAGLFACALALRSNGWRITAAVLGFIGAAACGFTALACMASAAVTRLDQPDLPNDFGGGSGPFSSPAEALNNAHLRQAFEQAAILATILGVLALIAAILIVTGNSNGWYTRNQLQVVAYGMAPAAVQQPGLPEGVVLKPAGWYPVDDGRLRWWNGQDWTEHFHDRH